MNTQLLLQDDWVEVITEELILMPDRVPFSVEPGLLGQYDAQLGLPCQPYERGYRTVADCESYIAAWQDTNAVWAEAVRELVDYQDWLAFQDDILWGQRGA